MKRIPMRWAIASALVAIAAVGCTTTVEETSKDGGGSGGSTGTGGGTGGGETGGTTGTGGGEAEGGTGGTTETDAETPGPCEACVYGNCPDTKAPCEADPECKDREDAFYACLAGGDTLDSCTLTFTGSMSEDGGAAASAIATCVDQNCVPQCSPATDGGTAGD